MSSDKERKRVNKTQCWEEADEEFYRESYAGEFDILPRDPSRLATFLPSKKNRSVANRQFVGDRTATGCSYQRHGSIISSTKRYKESTTITRNDVQVAMLPDLSENLTDEERTWEQIQEIKSMPISMSQKKELRAQLQSAEKLRLQGFDQLKWQQRKCRQLLRTKWKDIYSKLQLWHSSIKSLEGNFGAGVATYFLFIKWLLLLNVAIFCVVFCTIILPNFLIEENVLQKYDCIQLNPTNSCFENINDTLFPSVFDIVQGGGLVKRTLMFYGAYGFESYEQNNNNTIAYTETLFHYDLTLAYIISAFIVYLLSLIVIIKSGASGFKERLEECEGQFYQYCNIVFIGWDFCIANKKSSAIKQKAIHDEMLACLKTEYLNGEQSEKLCKIITIRCFVNFLIILILLGSGAFVYYILDYSYAMLKSEQNTDMKILFFEYLPQLTIVFFNMSIPVILNVIIKFENYSRISVIRITLFRTMVVRLLFLAIFLSRFYYLIEVDFKGNVDWSTDGTPPCWETYVGQQFYKLFITDFIFHIFVTFFINFPRSLFVKSLNNRFPCIIGERDFEISKHILDIIYGQILCWLGLLYSPFLPAIAACYCFFMFYIKKFECLFNSKPSYLIYRASKSKTLFMLLVLINFFITLVPVGYSITNIVPSECCGPFRGLTSAWESIQLSYMIIPDVIQNVFGFFLTINFTIPAFITLVLILCYYNIVYSVNKHMVSVLKKQLVLEGHDKQFLLDRLSSFIKQQQEYQKDLS